jgi:hypothetical protein
MTISVSKVDDTIPPTIGTAMRCITSAPVPWLHMIGSSPHHSWPPSEGPRMSAARFVRLSGLREDLMLRRVPRTRTALHALLLI